MSHFAALRQRPERGHAFHCYNPWNFQTRLLSCNSTDDVAVLVPGPDKEPHIRQAGAHDILDGELEPGLDIGLQSLKAMDWVSRLLSTYTH